MQSCLRVNNIGPMEANKHKWYVVSIDPALVGRIVAEAEAKEACEAVAQAYSVTQCSPGERVAVMCDHHEAIQRIKRFGNN